MLRTSPPDQILQDVKQIDNVMQESLRQIICTDNERLPPDVTKEACLPLALGGLGLTCLSDQSPAAYTASSLSTIQHWRKFIPDNDEMLQLWASDPALTASLASLSSALAPANGTLTVPLVLPSNPAQIINFTATDKLQRRLQGLRDLSTVTSFKSSRLSSPADRAQYLSKTSKGASAFLQACPTDRSLTIANDDMRLAIRVWLRLPLLPVFSVLDNIPCSCKPNVTLDESHIFNCNAEAARDIRHNVITYTFQEMLQQTQLNPVHLEPRASHATSDMHRFDLAVAGFDGSSTDLKIDISIRNPLAKHSIARASTTRLSAANEGVKEKHVKYDKYLSPRDWFAPLAIETFGALHPNVFKVLSAASSRVANVAPDSASFTAPTFSSYWLQRLSCSLWRENSRLAAFVIKEAQHLTGIHTYGDAMDVEVHVSEFSTSSPDDQAHL